MNKFTSMFQIIHEVSHASCLLPLASLGEPLSGTPKMTCNYNFRIVFRLCGSIDRPEDFHTRSWDVGCVLMLVGSGISCSRGWDGVGIRLGMGEWGISGGETYVGPKISYQMNAESLTRGADTTMLRTRNEPHCPNLISCAMWDFWGCPLFFSCHVCVWLCEGPFWNTNSCYASLWGRTRSFVCVASVADWDWSVRSQCNTYLHCLNSLMRQLKRPDLRPPWATWLWKTVVWRTQSFECYEYVGECLCVWSCLSCYLCVCVGGYKTWWGWLQWW